MHDNVTRKPRGFGFINFDFEDSVEEVMQKSFHELCGKLMGVKKAVPKEDNDVTGGNLFSNYSPYSPRCDLPGYGGIYGSCGGVYGGAHFGGISYGLGPRGATTMFWHQGKPKSVSHDSLSYMNNGYGLMGMAAHGYSRMIGSAPSNKLGQLSGGNEQNVAIDICNVDDNSLG